eukprot:GHVU01022344.1.p1 GENE.GHVU01022344.1~~GHVU01022344.1.p1  ORF type:complete len:292 (+),score=55.25 GHVU01022344.1:235-1110(+)
MSAAQAAGGEEASAATPQPSATGTAAAATAETSAGGAAQRLISKQGTLAVPETALTPEESYRIIEALEARLAECEATVGAAGAEITLAEPTEGVSPEWQAQVKVAVAPQPVVNQTRRLQKLADQVFASGAVKQFEEKHAELERWLENENYTISQLASSVKVKQTFVLEHRKQITELGELLKQIEEHRHVINSPTMRDALAIRDRLSGLEEGGHALAEQAVRLETMIQQLASDYSMTMNMISFWLKEIDGKLVEARLKAMNAAGGSGSASSRQEGSDAARPKVGFQSPTVSD